MKQLQGAKPFNIDRWELYHAYEQVKSKRGMPVSMISD